MQTARFTSATLTTLQRQCLFAADRDALENLTMTVQNTLPGGRINVSFDLFGSTSYRTFARRDLVISEDA